MTVLTIPLLHSHSECLAIFFFSELLGSFGVEWETLRGQG